MPARSQPLSRRPAVAAVALALLTLAGMVFLATFPVAQRWAGDLRLFEQYAALTFSGRLGDTPFLSWYPPLALVPMGVPLIAGGGWTYPLAFGAQMAVVAGAGTLLVGHATPPAGRAHRLFVYGVLVLLASAVVLWRYDIVPAVVTMGSLYAAATGRWGLAGAALGIATGLKLYAAILAPLLLLGAWRTDGRRAALSVIAAGGIVGLLAAGAYVLFPGASPTDLLAFTARRPLHLESVAGSVVAALATIGGTTTDVGLGFGSFNLSGYAADVGLGTLRVAQPIILAGSLAAAAAVIWQRRGQATIECVALAWTAALLGLLIGNRVLSPQYLVWLLPLAPFLPGLPLGLLVAAFATTAVVFPWLYSDLLALEPIPVALILVRNLLLVVAWAVVMVLLLRALGGSTSAAPARNTAHA